MQRAWKWIALHAIAYCLLAVASEGQVVTAQVELDVAPVPPIDNSSQPRETQESPSDLDLPPVVEPDGLLPEPDPFADDPNGQSAAESWPAEDLPATAELWDTECDRACFCDACIGRPLNRVFASVEYQHWYVRPRSLPPLVTTDLRTTPLDSGPPDNTPHALTVNNPLNTTSQILLGGEEVGTELLAGGRVSFGLWLDDCQLNAITLTAYGNQGDHLQSLFSSAGDPPLGRPFFNSNPAVNAEDRLVVAHDNFGLDQSGSIGSSAQNDIFGAEAGYRHLLVSGPRGRIDLVGGYVFNRIDDELLISMTIDDSVASTLSDSFDLLDASNRYHAGSLGLASQWYHGCWTLDLMGKVAVGNMEQRVAIAGETVTNGGTPVTGGFLAQSGNIGVHGRDRVVWSPQASAKLSYGVTRFLSLSVGYTFLYWDSVALAGDHIDRNINCVGGMMMGGDPSFRFHDSSFWAQTIDIGGTWNY